MREAKRAPDPDPDAEEAEEFYESLDRILSSSGSSTSASDDDADHHRRRRRAPSPPPAAAAAAVSSYDVWISEPSSVEERRRRLLLSMGLASYPSLSRELRTSPPSPPPAAEAEAEAEVGAVETPAPAVERCRSGGLGRPPLGRNPSGGEQCRIRNLDDGTEFEVGELPEVRELGTGRQLTLEEFELCVGRSPIVQELMRRATSPDSPSSASGAASTGDSTTAGARTRKKGGGWLRSIKHMAGNVGSAVAAAGHARRSSDDKQKSSEKDKAARRLSSATDESLDGSGSATRSANAGAAERIRVRQYGKACKELTGVFLTQQVQAHTGSIWCIKFSLDGRYLASAGEDQLIHVWEVSESERKAELFGEGVSARENGGCSPFLSVIGNGSPEMALSLSCIEGSYGEKKRRPRLQSSRKSVGSDNLVVPECVFGLGEKALCSLQGHAADVLDLSWSKSQYLLSSSMDKTVKLWNITTSTCLKTFSHSDYVTCIQFNPVDDKFFISGSLDEKVRIWSVPDRQIVDWNDLHEMVTAACYTPDGQGALVGSHKGSCHLFDTSENKLQHKSQVHLRIKKKKSGQKKITGFQFAPGSSSEVLITSADSRIRVVNGDELVHKFKGFRNTSSQISASVAPNGKYVVCASEDSHVYVWRHDTTSQPSRGRSAVDVTNSYEHFHCHDVTVAITWPGAEVRGSFGSCSSRHSDSDAAVGSNREGPVANNELDSTVPESPSHGGVSNTSINSHYGDRASVKCPKEKLPSAKSSPAHSSELFNEAMEVQRRSAWGLVIVTAGQGGEIRVFQNFGFPVHV